MDKAVEKIIKERIQQDIARFESDDAFNIFDVVKAYIVRTYSVGIQTCRIEDGTGFDKKITLMSDGAIMFQAHAPSDFIMMGTKFMVTFLATKQIDPVMMTLSEIKDALLRN